MTETTFKLLEVLGIENSVFIIGEKINISRDNKTKVKSVLGRLQYRQLSDKAKNSLKNIFTKVLVSQHKWLYRDKSLTKKRIDRLFEKIIIQQIDLSEGIIHRAFRIDW